MRWQILLTAALDGFIHAFLLMLMIEVAISPLSLSLSAEAQLMAAIILGAVSAGIYGLLLRRMQESRHISWITLLSILFCLLTLAGGIAWSALVPLQLLPVREGNAGDGLLLLLMTLSYLVTAGVLRILLWLLLAGRCRMRKKDILP